MKKIFLLMCLFFMSCAQDNTKVICNKSFNAKSNNVTTNETRKFLKNPQKSFVGNTFKDKNKKNEINDKKEKYQTYLAYAARYITLGNFYFALDNIKEAQKYMDEEDPYFYELRGTIYDGLEEENKAFKDFYKAMTLYYQNKNYEKALQMLAYLESIDFGNPKLKAWEKKIKLKLYEERMKRLEEENRTKNKRIKENIQNNIQGDVK